MKPTVCVREPDRRAGWGGQRRAEEAEAGGGGRRWPKNPNSIPVVIPMAKNPNSIPKTNLSIERTVGATHLPALL